MDRSSRQLCNCASRAHECITREPACGCACAGLCEAACHLAQHVQESLCQLLGASGWVSRVRGALLPLPVQLDEPLGCHFGVTLFCLLCPPAWQQMRRASCCGRSKKKLGPMECRWAADRGHGSGKVARAPPAHTRPVAAGSGTHHRRACCGGPGGGGGANWEI